MYAKVLSIDPGGTTMGLSISEYDEEKKKVVCIYATTFNFEKMLKLYPSINSVYGDTYGRFIVMELALTKFLNEWKPNHVVCESGYMGKFVTTFASLTTCLTILRLCLYKYDKEMILETVDPATVKTKMKVSGQSGDKVLMTKALKQTTDIELNIDINSLDDHAIDAICIGYGFIKKHLRS